jgi:excisionase family DNA binding protein
MASDRPEDSLERLLDAACDRAVEKSARRLESLSQSRSESPYLNVEEAAAYLRCKPQRVHDLLSQGKLTRYKDGARTLILRSELDEYVQPKKWRCFAFAFEF